MHLLKKGNPTHTDTRPAPHPRAAQRARASASGAANKEGPNRAPLRPHSRAPMGKRRLTQDRRAAPAPELSGGAAASPLIEPTPTVVASLANRAGAHQRHEANGRTQGRCGASRCRPGSARAAASSCTALPSGIRAPRFSPPHHERTTNSATAHDAPWRSREGKRKVARGIALLCINGEGRSEEASTIFPQGRR